VPIVLKFGSLNLLEPSGPVQACNGIAFTVGRDSSVGIVTRYGLDGLGIESRWGRDFPHLSRPALKLTQPTIQWVPGLSRGSSRWGVALTTHPHLAPRFKKEYICFQPLKYCKFSKTRFISCQGFLGLNITYKIFIQESRVDYFCRAGKHATVNLLIERLRLSRGSLLAFGTQIRGFKPGRSRRIFRTKKNPQHAFLRKGSKAVGPMS